MTYVYLLGSLLLVSMGFAQAPTVGEERTVALPDVPPITFIWIPAGSFMMGAPLAEQAQANVSAPERERLHRVTLRRGFWLGKYEVTWAQWKAVMGWDDARGQPNHPARRFSWNQAQIFIERLNARVDTLRFRMPTEAEWEYAARAGTTAPWSSGNVRDSLLAYAWVRDNAFGRIQEVGTKKPNAWGLHDMHGNVWEWVQDWFDSAYYRVSPTVNPQGPATGTERVRRGGSAVYSAPNARSAHRYANPPDRGNGNIGMRLMLEQRGIE